MTNAASVKGNAKRNKQAEADRQTDKTVITTLMSTVAGRRWIWLRLSEAQVFTEDGSLDPYWMAYTKGIRNSGLRLLASVTRNCPAMYVRMTEENTGVDLTTPETSTDEEENG